MATTPRSAGYGFLAAIPLVLLGLGCNQKGSVVSFQPPPTMKAPVVAEPPEPVSPPANEPPPVEETSQGAPPILAVPLPQAETPTEFPPGILYSDSFADLAGSIRRHEGGKQLFEGPRNSRLVFFFMGMPQDGELIMRVYEDPETHGSDDKPGVLALSWQEVPASLPYSGFVYLGRNDSAGRMKLQPLQTAAAPADLEGIRLKFRFKGRKADAEAPVKINIGLRLEPALPDSFNKRLDLGQFVATEEWGSFEAALTEGKNIEKFLRTISEEKPTSFKLVWAQASAIKDYQAGDTLLLDDIEISKATTE